MKIHLTKSQADGKAFANTAPEPVFVLDGLVYLPHYCVPVWVQPGSFTTALNHRTDFLMYKEDESKRLSASELFARGALVEEELLWPREWTKGWRNWLRP